MNIIEENPIAGADADEEVRKLPYSLQLAQIGRFLYLASCLEIYLVLHKSSFAIVNSSYPLLTEGWQLISVAFFNSVLILLMHIFYPSFIVLED